MAGPFWKAAVRKRALGRAGIECKSNRSPLASEYSVAADFSLCLCTSHTVCAQVNFQNSWHETVCLKNGKPCLVYNSQSDHLYQASYEELEKVTSSKLSQFNRRVQLLLMVSWLKYVCSASIQHGETVVGISADLIPFFFVFVFVF